MAERGTAPIPRRPPSTRVSTPEAPGRNVPTSDSVDQQVHIDAEHHPEGNDVAAQGSNSRSPTIARRHVHPNILAAVRRYVWKAVQKVLVRSDIAPSSCSLTD